MAMEKKFVVINLFVLVFSIFLVNAQQERCYADSNSPYVNFVTKTSYFASRGNELKKIPGNCSPVYIWSLIRHGTRYPNDKFIESMKNLNNLKNAILLNHKEGRGKLCKNDLKNLEKWSYSITMDLQNELTSQGVKDLSFLANKFKKVFPDLLKKSSKDSFIFQSSQYKRTKDSALVFTNELLGTNFANTDGNGITENEELLHICKHCPKYSAEVENNPSVLKEATLFKSSGIVQTMKSDISTYLGFKEPLPFESLELMYDICAYESAWYIDSRPPFCAAFSSEQVKVFEYLGDLEDYYLNGYGNSLTEKIGCLMVRDMFTTLLNAAKDPNYNRKATFYFSHAEMIFPTTVKLGLHRDEEPLKHDNYEKMKEGRKWKTALFNSFASNIAAVLYRCQSPKGDQNTVVVYQNERQVVLPKCNKNPCSLEDLQQSFAEVFDETQCNLKFCQIQEPAEKSNGNIVFLSLSAVFISFFLHAICKYD